ncbi:MAG: permease [Jatrophihabitans sp.]|uniref:permease n=1 Tax=Jatrophihabitans sp. TaxID=1932789 RepID=UPI003F81B3CD
MSYTDPGYGETQAHLESTHFSGHDHPHAQAAHDWKRRGLLAVIGVALLLIGWLIATSFLPRWWAHRAADMANGTFHWGITWGLFFGIVSTFVPLLVALTTYARGMKWGTRAWIMVVAVLLAAPNLMTLGIVLGSNNAAHAGQRTLDTDAPGFRGATIAGAIIAVVAVIAIEVFLVKHRRQRRELQQLRVEHKLRRADAA